MNCPFCGHDPFHYVDNGVGMEAVAVTCCDLGDLFFRGARQAPEEVTMSWADFINIGARLAAMESQSERAIEMIEGGAPQTAISILNGEQ